MERIWNEIVRFLKPSATDAAPINSHRRVWLSPSAPFRPPALVENDRASEAPHQGLHFHRGAAGFLAARPEGLEAVSGQDPAFPFERYARY